MVRKYLNRKDTPNEQKNDEESFKDIDLENDKMDPMDVKDKKLFLSTKEQTQKNSQSTIAKDQINKAEQYMQYINSQLADRLLRIEKIKRSHENFEREIEMLQIEKSKQLMEKASMLGKEITPEPESVKATRELSELIQKYAVEKLDMMKKLFDSEKKQSNELYKKLQENLSKITISEEKLKQQRDQLELEVRDKTIKLAQAERLSAIGEFSARLAHDLRNPLTVIKGTVEIIKAKNNESTSGFSQKQIEMMERAVLRMSHQIDDVLDFVKIQTLYATKNSLFETIGLSVAKAPKSEDLSIEVIGQNVDFVYDADKLEVVFDNLISNAIDAINHNGKITISVFEKDNDVLIEIQDSGKGVPQEHLAKIFEPLFTTKQKGTGLGLASCKSIVEQHGGNISVQNNPSVFKIRLPKLQENSNI